MDDMTITHTTGPIVRVDDYYPFGLTFNTNEREGSLTNKYLFNGKERQELTSWDDYGARMYDQEIGRWHVIDPLSEKMSPLTPYHYTYNNPIKYIDLLGLEPKDRTGEDEFLQRMAAKSFEGRFFNENKCICGDSSQDDIKYNSSTGELTINTTDKPYDDYYIDEVHVARYNKSSSGGHMGIIVDDRAIGGTVHVKYVESRMGPKKLSYSENLDLGLTIAGGVAGAFETGAAVGTFQGLKHISFTTAKMGLKLTKGLGTAGVVLSGLVAGHEVITGKHNTHTWVDLGVTVFSVGAVIAAPAALPIIATGGLIYGIWSASGGSDWIDSNFGY